MDKGTEGHVENDSNYGCILFLFQDEKNQIMKSNVWLRMVRLVYGMKYLVMLPVACCLICYERENGI